MATEANVSQATREAWLRTVREEVFHALPFMAMLLEERRIKFPGGISIKETVIKDDLKSLGQSYTPNTPLTSGSKTVLENPEWTIRYFQIPVEYGIEAALMNKLAEREHAPVDLVKTLVKVAHRGAREFLNDMIYSEDESDETGSDFQSVPYALEHDTTYGGLSRATTVTNSWWQGVSPAGTYADQSTDIGATIATNRKVARLCRKYMKPNTPLYSFVGGTLFDKYLSQVEAHFQGGAPEGKLGKYGFDTVRINRVEYVYDPTLDASGKTTQQFWIAPETWSLDLAKGRGLRLTDFKWQGDTNNGVDKWLARIMAAGNLICHQPNANCWLDNLT